MFTCYLYTGLRKCIALWVELELRVKIAEDSKWSGQDFITMTKKHDHITPVLMSLHGLPVLFQIQYILLVTVLRRCTGRHHNAIMTLQNYMFFFGHCGRTIQDFLSSFVCAQNNMEICGLNLLLLYCGTLSRQIYGKNISVVFKKNH